jgi:hypothetical protein
VVQSSPGKIVCETLSQKSHSQKGGGGVAQGESPEFKPQYHKKKKEIIHDQVESISGIES